MNISLLLWKSDAAWFFRFWRRWEFFKLFQRFTQFCNLVLSHNQFLICQYESLLQVLHILFSFAGSNLAHVLVSRLNAMKLRVCSTLRIKGKNIVALDRLAYAFDKVKLIYFQVAQNPLRLRLGDQRLIRDFNKCTFFEFKEEAENGAMRRLGNKDIWHALIFYIHCLQGCAFARRFSEFFSSSITLNPLSDASTNARLPTIFQRSHISRNSAEIATNSTKDISSGCSFVMVPSHCNTTFAMVPRTAKNNSLIHITNHRLGFFSCGCSDDLPAPVQKAFFRLSHTSSKSSLIECEPVRWYPSLSTG